jgi:hypothetical protein
MCQYLRWHFFKKLKQNQMNDKHLVRQIDAAAREVNLIFDILVDKIKELENDLVELEKQHEQSLKVAFEKGYEEGVKYTDGLISDERFPF